MPQPRPRLLPALALRQDPSGGSPTAGFLRLGLGEVLPPANAVDGLSLNSETALGWGVTAVVPAAGIGSAGLRGSGSGKRQGKRRRRRFRLPEMASDLLRAAVGDELVRPSGHRVLAPVLGRHQAVGDVRRPATPCSFTAALLAPGTTR
jgi:hypothetical protein